MKPRHELAPVARRIAFGIIFMQGLLFLRQRNIAAIVNCREMGGFGHGTVWSGEQSMSQHKAGEA